MRILGFTETSLIDWDGKITSVVFVGGCNFCCPYCHNRDVAADNPSLPAIQWGEVRELIERKQGWLDGVVVTGGEPMMHPEVFDLCHGIKGLGAQVKVDTNGSFPYPLKKLISLKLVDYVAMDIKAPLNRRYSVAAGRRLELSPLRRTIKLLVESGIGHEFRITAVPGLVNPDDMPDIGRTLRGAKSVVLQQFDPELAPVKAYQEKTPYTLAQAEAMAQELKPFVNSVKLRGKFL
ncbi:MAG: anaerobic ribonucleoside-triphosphate reductase activating protein [candidate division WOR-3 bacterium]